MAPTFLSQSCGVEIQNLLLFVTQVITSILWLLWYQSRHCFLDYDEVRAGFHIIAMIAAKKLRESLDHIETTLQRSLPQRRSWWLYWALIWTPTLGDPRLASWNDAIFSDYIARRKYRVFLTSCPWISEDDGNYSFKSFYKEQVSIFFAQKQNRRLCHWETKLQWLSVLVQSNPC